MSALQTFFDEYRTAFTRYDVEALAELFAFPVHVVSADEDAVDIRVFSREEWRSVLSGLLDAYRSLGVTDAEIVALAVTELAPRVASVRVGWRLRHADRGVVYDFTAIYTLARLDGAWRVAGIAHDEVPRLRAALGRSRTAAEPSRGM